MASASGSGSRPGAGRNSMLKRGPRLGRVVVADGAHLSAKVLAAMAMVSSSAPIDIWLGWPSRS
jgi:hypothetical protein